MKDDDLFEYSAEHAGTRRYVSVRGYSRSIPKYKTFVNAQGYNCVLPEYGGSEMPCTSGSPFYMPDKAEYVSPIDGTVVAGRTAHRRHCATHNVIECGDRPIGKAQPVPDTGYSSRDIVDAIRQLGGH